MEVANFRGVAASNPTASGTNTDDSASAGQSKADSLSGLSEKSVTNATLAAIVVGVIALGVGIYIGIRHKLKWWYYLLLVLFIVPMARFATASTVLLASKKA